MTDKQRILACPHCGDRDRQVKAGVSAGVQRYKCNSCGRRYSLDTRPRAYDPSTREMAAKMRSAGASIRKIARDLGVSPQSVSNWLVAEQGDDDVIHLSPPNLSDPPPSEPTGKSRITITDVAVRAGVSTSTVSNYLNDKGRMSHETRQRIGDAIKTLYFTPSALVRAIRQGHTYTIGLLSYGIYDLETNADRSIVPPLLGAINRAADQAGYNVLLYTGWPHRSNTPTGSDFLNGQIDGLLWVSPEPTTEQLKYTANAGLPVMSIMSRRVPDNVGYVVADNIGGARRLVEYLASLGHRRIAHLGSMDTSDFIDRVTGYREGLANAGLPVDPEIEYTGMRLNWNPTMLNQVLDWWTKLPAPPTAIVAADDGLADILIEEIRRRGLKVPEDIAVTGFNDLPSAERLCGGITTMHQPFGDIGRIAVEQLKAMISGAPAGQCRITLPVDLVIRSSTQPSS